MVKGLSGLFNKIDNLMDAYTSLDRIVSGDSLTAGDRTNLQKASYLMDRDNNSELERVWQKLGYKTRPDFLDNLYLSLNSGGETNLTNDELKHSKDFLRKMADLTLIAIHKYC